MNDADLKLQEFFYDIGNIERYKDNSQSLSDFYDECFAIIKNKTYSNINLQDENGNTYLHHLANRTSWNWFIDLLHLGADPTILNNKGNNAFHVCPSPSSVFNFWRINTISRLDSFMNPEWSSKTENFAPNFKQFLFEGHLLDNKHSFESIEKAFDFLHKANLDTDINKIRIVAISTHIGIEKKIDWYESNYNSPEFNTEFLIKIIKAPPFIGDKSYYYEGVAKSLERELIQNEGFNKAAREIILDAKDDARSIIYRNLLKSMIRQGFNFDVEVDYYKNTLIKLIQNNSFTHKVFLDETLKNNPSSKKIIKV